MKYSILWTLAGVLCFGCGQNTPTVNPPPPVPQTQPVAEEVPPEPMDSVYVVQQFLADAARTLSPYAMSKLIEYPLFGFRFTPTQLNGFTIHEGGYDCDLKYDPATKKYTSKGIPGVPGFELLFQPDGTIQLTYFRLKKTYIFRKVADIDTALRQVMFAGKYTDSKTKTTVEFKADGTLIGLGTEKTYVPFYDYVAGPLDFDEMRVSEKSDPSKERYFHYKFKGYTLELYEAIQPKADDPAGLEKIGALRYTLIRN